MTAFSVLVALTSAALIPLGLAIATDFRGVASTIAELIAGPVQMRQRNADRFWALLPLSLGIGFPITVALNTVSSAASGIAAARAVAVYLAAMITLAWSNTPSERRAIGPFFWTRRAAAIPALAFFAYVGLLSLPLLLQPAH